MQPVSLACLLRVVTRLVSAFIPRALAPVESPLPVAERERALDEYDDRLLGALAAVIGKPDLPASERVVVAASPKIELMFLAAGMASDWHLFPRVAAATGTLRSSALDHFGAVRRHDAVGHLKRMRDTGFWYDALPHLALAFADPPSLEQVYPLSAYLQARSRGGEADLRDLMTRLRDFAGAGDWEGWWSAHEAEYVEVEEHCRQVYRALDPLGRLESYFGERLEALVVIPSAMISCGFGGTIEDPLGSWAINCFGPATPAALPSEGYLEGIVLHEGGHAFVNHHAYERPEIVAELEHLYTPIAAQMKQQAYGNWMTALNEHVLRACHARMYLEFKGEAAALEMLEQEEGRGFIYIRPLYDKLAEYEADRERWPDFGAFYEELLAVLEAL